MVSNSLILSQADYLCPHSSTLAHANSFETGHSLCHAAYMVWGGYGYSRIDLETYARVAVMISN
jgi:hypothetical protein